MFKYIVALGILLTAAGAAHCDHAKDHGKSHGGKIAAPATP